MSERDAKNYAAVARAKETHNRECPGEASELHISPYDIQRLDWEEGESICGLVVVANEQVNPGMMRVVCDRDKQGDETFTTEAVANDRTLVPA